MAAAVKVDRARVMAYRMKALGLATRGRKRPADLAVLDLGVQESTPGSTQVAFGARTTADPDDDRLIMVWAARGAPHLHRRSDLPALAAALWPVSDADASARIGSGQIPEGTRLGIEAFTATAEAFRDVVTTSMPRGEVSAQVSARVPASLTYECRACEARHIAGTVFQHAGLAGGVQVEARGSGATLGPVPDWPGVPTESVGVGDVLSTYLRLLGPATQVEAAKYLGSATKEIRQVWPDGLAEVEVEGKKAWLPESAVTALRTAERPTGVRLIPAMDPLLQARDRDRLVPDRNRQKEVWRILGNPGAVLVDGDVAGVWRAKMAGRSRVDITVMPFEKLSAKARAAIDAESAVVARARGVADATVTIEDV